MKFWQAIERMMFESVDLAGGGRGGESVDLGTVIADSIPQDQRDTPPVQDTKPEMDEAEEKELAALEADIRGKNPNMRGNIAIHRHQAVLTRTRNQHTKAAEEWTAKEKAWAEREAKIKEQESEWEQYAWAKDPEIQSGLQALALAEADQDKFIDLLLQDPRYAERLQRIAKAEEKKLPSDRPRPNQKTEDGKLEYYDDDGVLQLLDWHGGKLKGEITASLKKEIQAEMQAKYGKVADAYQQSTNWNEAKAQSAVKLDEYRTNWDGFKEYEKDIKAALVANDEARAKDKRVPLLSIEEAYIRTVPAKLRASAKVAEDEMRKKILEEMKAKPGKVADVKPGRQPERVANTGDRDLADVIRESMRQAQG